MRLTLRTLLAYLDDILEPDDRQAIGNKIEESEYAKTLVHRTRDVISRMRLGSPEVMGAGMGRDPNSVAEYLDNTMAPEQIQDFEKVCLESDVHLAEVAASHHVLAMVLGEPAQVDPASRERMYRLAEGTTMRIDQMETMTAPPESEPQPEPQPVAVAPQPVPVEPTAEKRDEPQDPTPTEEREAAASAVHEMRSGRDKPTPAHIGGTAAPQTKSRFWPVAITAVVAALITGGALMVIDPDFRKFLGGEDPSVAKAQPQTPIEDATPKSPVAPPATDGTLPGVPIADGTQGPASLPVDEPLTVVDPVAPSPEAIPDEPPVTPPEAPPATDQVVTPPDDSTGPMPPETPGPATDGTSPPEDGTSERPVDTPPVQVARADDPPDPATPEPTEGTDEPPAAAQRPVTIGRLLSQDQILLSTRTTHEELARLPPRASLNVGDKLIVLPTFRPMISIAATTIELEGGTMIELVGIDDDGTPEILIRYGRLIARSLSMPNARIHLRMGDHEGTISFGDGDSTFAAEVRPHRTPGADPEKIASHVAVDLFAPSGTITWSTTDGDVQLPAPIRRTLSAHPADGQADAAAMPRWIMASEISPLDERAVGWIEQGLSADRGVRLSLTELSEHQRTEIRRLAVRCSGHVGHFEPLVKSLSDADMRPRWNIYVPELVDAVARDPAMAAKVRATFEKFRGEEAFELYRMLWGYGATGLTKGGEAAKLVEFLDHDDLDYRVLSFWNLQAITGLGLNYRPEYTKIKRRQSIDRWTQRLKREEIVPSSSAEAAPPAAGS